MQKIPRSLGNATKQQFPKSRLRITCVDALTDSKGTPIPSSVQFTTLLYDCKSWYSVKSTAEQEFQ